MLYKINFAIVEIIIICLLSDVIMIIISHPIEISKHDLLKYYQFYIVCLLVLDFKNDNVAIENVH